MSHALTEANDTYTASIIVPDGGDPRTAASVEEGMQDLADRLNFIRRRVEGAAASYKRSVKLMITNATNFNWAGAAYGVHQHSVAGTPINLFQITVPRGDGVSKLTEVKIYFKPASGHGGVPAGLPEALLDFQPGSGGAAVSVVGSVVLPTPGSVGAYEVAQTLTLTPGGGGHVLQDPASGGSYWVAFGGENGANAAAGLVVNSITYTMVPV